MLLAHKERKNLIDFQGQRSRLLKNEISFLQKDHVINFRLVYEAYTQDKRNNLIDFGSSSSKSVDAVIFLPSLSVNECTPWKYFSGDQLNMVTLPPRCDTT